MNKLSGIMSEILKGSDNEFEPKVTYIVSRHGRGSRPIIKSVCNRLEDALNTLKEYKQECAEGQFVTFDVRIYNSMFDNNKTLKQCLDAGDKENG